MSCIKWTLVPIIALAILSPSATAEGDKDFFVEALEAVRIGDGVWAEQLVLFPLIAKETPADLELVADRDADGLVFLEPKWPEKRFNVGVANGGQKPVLVLGGSALRGGRLDRLLPRDTILPSKHQMEMETLIAEYPKDRRGEALPFRFGPAVAPSYLRERAAFDPTRYLVPIFVSHFLDFRNQNDARRSLAALDDSQLLAEFCLPCQQATRKFPDVDGAKVVGFITAVRGRLSSLELFGTNELLRAYFPHILHGHTYEAAAIELKANGLGMPIPGRGDQKATLALARKAAEKFLGSLKEVRARKSGVPASTLGTRLLLRTRKSQGTAIGLDGRLVHAVVYPDNPFEEALFSTPFERPQEKSGAEETFGNLDRREERGTLTEYEKRLLNRMRSRRGR